MRAIRGLPLTTVGQSRVVLMQWYQWPEASNRLDRFDARVPRVRGGDLLQGGGHPLRVKPPGCLLAQRLAAGAFLELSGRSKVLGQALSPQQLGPAPALAREARKGAHTAL